MEPDRGRDLDAILRILRELYPDADCTLTPRDPFQLLVSAILAAQCTDARVNLVTPDLFRRYPDISAFAEADRTELEAAIRSCGFFRTKARAIQESARRILLAHDGQVPGDMAALLALPGVGRKIANLLLGDAFGVPGVVVDTHAGRISRLLGLTDHTDPARIEQDLRRLLPESEWTSFGHRLVAHGRALCIARRPRCGVCPLRPHCRTGRSPGPEVPA